MIVNQANAAVVYAIFSALTDPRFTMRSVTAIKKQSEELTSAAVMDVAAQIGLPIRRRAIDDKMYVQRLSPVTVAQEIATKAAAVMAGTGAEFDVDFSAPAATEVELDEDGVPVGVDLMGDIESGLPN
jgi:hypothetical protein